MSARRKDRPRAIIELILADPKRRDWSTRRIAEAAGCSQLLASTVRDEILKQRRTRQGQVIGREGRPYDAGEPRPRPPLFAPTVRPASFGDLIHELRVKRGWTLAHVANAAGLTRKHLERLERGQARPGELPLLRMANLFGVSADKLAKGKS